MPSLIEWLMPEIHLPSEWNRSLTHMRLDSREVKKGDVFCALKGTVQEGQAFIPQAQAQGAALILVEATENKLINSTGSVPIVGIHDLTKKLGMLAQRFYEVPTDRLKIYGVTGTNGKTSSTYYLAGLLTQLDQPCAILGTTGNGLLGQLRESTHTSMNAIALQRQLAEFAHAGITSVAMEISSHALSQYRVESTPFQATIFTNLSRDHLDYHGSMEAYAEAKKRLFFEFSSKVAVINYDDPIGKIWLKELPKNLDRLSYSIQSGATQDRADFHATNVQCLPKGIVATLQTPWGITDIELPLFGQFNLSNVLSAIAVLYYFGFSLGQIQEALIKLPQVPGRMQRLGGKDKWPMAIVDYAHTPDALEKVLLSIRAHCTGRVWCVFGCGGNRDSGKRAMMARVAEEHADEIILTDDNPRHEAPEAIVNDVLQGFNDKHRVKVIHNRREAIKAALHSAQATDVVLIAGKGHETYQQIGDERLPFNDVEEVTCIVGD